MWSDPSVVQVGNGIERGVSPNYEGLEYQANAFLVSRESRQVFSEVMILKQSHG